MDIEDSPTTKRPHSLPHNFPSVACPVHDRPIIFTCIRPDCTYPRIFLCSKCVHDELSHVNLHTPMHIFEDFVEYIAKEDPAMETEKNDSKGLLGDMDSNLNDYNETVKEEQSNIKKILSELNDTFQEKSEELVSLLESQLLSQSETFQERYNKLEGELSVDDLSSAQLLKFKEISSEISKIRGSEKQCEFLKTVLKKRQAWEEASLALKEYPKRSFEFYENIVAKQLESKPKLQNKDQLVETWNKGLNSLVQKVLSQAQMGDLSLNENPYISLHLDRHGDLELLTDEMLRPETLLSFKPKGEEKVKSDVLADCLGRLPGLHALSLDFSLLPVKTEDLHKAVASLPDLKQLKYFELNLAGVALNAEGFQDLVKKIKGCKGLNVLSLNFSQTGVSAFGDIIEGLSEMKHLNELHLNLSGNKVDSTSIEALVISLRALKHLESLGLNISGYSQSGAAVDKKAIYKLLNIFAELSSLRKLALDLGHNGLTDEHLIELADSLKKLLSLRQLELVLNNNKLEERAARKIGKTLTKINVTSLNLNIHSNDLGSQGAEDLLGFLKDGRKWAKAEINLRNIGVNKVQANAIHQQFAQDNVKIVF